MSLLENEKEELNVMIIDYDLIFSIDSKIFKNIIKSINNISDYLVISCTKENSIEMSSNSTFAKFIIKPQYDIIKFSQIKTKYIDLSILNILSKFTSIIESIDIELSNDIPHLLSYNLQDLVFSIFIYHHSNKFAKNPLLFFL